MATDVSQFGNHVVTRDGPMDLDGAPFTLDASDARFYEPENRPAFEWIHEHGGIYHLENPRDSTPFVNACTHEFAKAIGGDPHLFSTHLGLHLESALYGFGDNPMPDDPRLHAAMRTAMLMQPDEHAMVRGPINKFFQPRALAEYEDVFRERIRALLDQIEPDSEGDFMWFARQVSLQVLTSYMGVDPSREQDFDRWERALMDSFEPGAKADWDTILELIDYVEDEIRKRHADPTNDLITKVINAGLPEGDAQAVMWCWVFIAGGIETTECLIGGGMRHLLEHPDQMRHLVEDPARIRAGVAEMLRYTSVGRYARRTATEDTALGGVEIKAGTPVVFNIAVANRDPDVYPDPYRFDVTREQSELTSFGSGRHSCLGSPLARYDTRLAFEELFKRFPNTVLNGEPKTQPKVLLASTKSLPVIYRA